MNVKAGEDRVFLLAHTVLLGVVLVGFARSFYLRELFLRTASGEASKSEKLGLGNHEFVPWQIGIIS